MAHLDKLERLGAENLRNVSGNDLVGAWWSATDDLSRQLPTDLRHRMAASAGLSEEGLEAGLDVVVRGVRTEAASRLLMGTPPPAAPLRPALVVLASNLPGMALQCLLPALAARRPLLLKTPSSEPEFTPWMLHRLTQEEPSLATAFAAATWRGGDRAVEDLVVPRVARLVAYGDDGAMRDLGRRADDATLVGHGHRISIGLATASSDLDVTAAARGLARDVALFDQRGCLSVRSVLVTSPDAETAAEGLVEGLAEDLAGALAEGLARQAEELPPGPCGAGRLAAVRAAREEAVMAGHRVLDLPLRQGTVILEQERDSSPARLEGPGLRTVRIVPCRSRRSLLETLEPWRGRLQGVSLAGGDGSGTEESGLMDELRRLGVTRVAAAGQLQEVDAATWQNGGRSPLGAYSDTDFGLA